jgi:hypothetical protein
VGLAQQAAQRRLQPLPRLLGAQLRMREHRDRRARRGRFRQRAEPGPVVAQDQCKEFGVGAVGLLRRRRDAAALYRNRVRRDLEHRLLCATQRFDQQPAVRPDRHRHLPATVRVARRQPGQQRAT